MRPATIHHLNTGLILFSCVMAYVVPFELFLFSYAVLGPLHYLTEIGWLHQKNYFTRGRYDFLFLAGACLLLAYYNYNATEENINTTADIIFFTLLTAAVFVFVRAWTYRLVFLALGLLLTWLIRDSFHFFIWFAIFLPTIIHVLVFTWAFMLYGVLKERSLPGLVSVLALMGCVLVIIFFRPEGLVYRPGEYTLKSYEGPGELNYFLISYFRLDRLKDISQIYTGAAGFMVMRLIAFAYTYHYLNWFSKTSVIQWHRVPKKTLYITLVSWLMLVALYIYDYGLGLKLLFVLSFLHVFLEFPLNVVSLAGIGKALLPGRGIRRGPA